MLNDSFGGKLSFLFYISIQQSLLFHFLLAIASLVIQKQGNNLIFCLIFILTGINCGLVIDFYILKMNSNCFNLKVFIGCPPCENEKQIYTLVTIRNLTCLFG